MANLRQPQLNLDSVYGNGPGGHAGLSDEVPYNPAPADAFERNALRRAQSRCEPARRRPAQRHHRSNSVDGRRRPLIGDGRNDENLVIAQLHVSFLRFHNNTLDLAGSNHPEAALPVASAPSTGPSS